MSSLMLNAAAQLAERLRLRKVMYVQGLAQGITQIVFSRSQLWSAEDVAAVADWDSLSSDRCLSATYLRSRLEVWRRLAQGCVETGGDPLQVDIREVWESKDECALMGWEHYLARETGQTPLFDAMSYA